MSKTDFFNSRKEDTAKQEIFITELQGALNQLQSVNDAKEKALLESSKKVEQLQQSMSKAASALKEIQLLLHHEEQKRGRQFYDTKSATSVGPDMLVYSLDACLQEYHAEIKRMEKKISEATVETEKIKNFSLEAEQKLHLENKARFVLWNFWGWLQILWTGISSLTLAICLFSVYKNWVFNIVKDDQHDLYV